jgi:hypothetical protein
VTLAGVGVPAQAAFLARTADTHLTAPHEHHIRTLLIAAARRVPAGARYAVTSAARESNAVYFVRQAAIVDVDFTGPASAVRSRLANRRVRFVVVFYRNRPPAFTSRSPTWYRVLVSLRAGQLVEVTG